MVAVQHRTASPPGSNSKEFLRTNQRNSVHFLIGRKGELWQFLDTIDCSWGNGVVHAGPDTPAWLRKLVEQGHNPNTFSISIEHEAAGAYEGFTEAQIQTSIRLNRWIADRHPKVLRDRSHFIGHYQIDAVNKALCPNKSLFPFDRLIAALSEDGAPGRVRAKLFGESRSARGVPLLTARPARILAGDNVRRSPSTKGPVVLIGPEDDVRVLGYDEGEAVDGNRVWYLVAAGYHTHGVPDRIGYAHASILREDA